MRFDSPCPFHSEEIEAQSPAFGNTGMGESGFQPRSLSLSKINTVTQSRPVLSDRTLMKGNLKLAGSHIRKKKKKCVKLILVTYF